MTTFGEQIAVFRAAADDAAEWSKAAAQQYGRIASELEEAVRLLDAERERFEQLQRDYESACRWRDRFRMALHTYLQERQQIGPYAPTNDTAQHIIRLLEEHDA